MERMDRFARLRTLYTLLAVTLDIGIYLGFRGSLLFDQHVLRQFVLINVPLLIVSAAVSWFGVRRTRSLRWQLGLTLICLGIESFTGVVWIQLTGTVSSYFLTVIPVFVLVYRLYVGYLPGVLALGLGSGMHLGAYLLEELGVLRQAPLFVANPGELYSTSWFRIAAMISINLMFAGIFMLANLVARALVEQARALDVAQRDLDRAVEEVQPGRLSGHVLDKRYRLGELLGRGGMGEVYQATPLDGGAPVAVKILYGHACTPDEIERFHREASIARRLPPTRVAQVLEFGESREGGHQFLVMELLHGEDLATLLRRRGRLSAAELLAIVEPLAGGLEEAHAIGVVHRDLKPQNVFLCAGSSPPEVRLLDFGVARLIEGSELTQTAMVLGSPGYLAPEQVVTSRGEVGPHTDVFALGAIVYRALTGQSAFPSRHPAAAAYEALHLEPAAASSLNRELSVDVDAVLKIAMAKDPARRYARPTELVRDLRAALEGRLEAATRERAGAVPQGQGPSYAYDATLNAGVSSSSSS